MDRIEWVLERCRLLRAIGDEYHRKQPFAGLTIGTGIHLEPKTVALLKGVTVSGYGACGKGVAANFRNAYATFSVVEIDPVKRLQALLDGFLVPEREEALRSADVVVTVTGAPGVRRDGLRTRPRTGASSWCGRARS